MTYNDADWSNFWARGSSRTKAPSASSLFVGKMVGEDVDNTRADETIGYFVIESSNDGTIEGLPFRAGVGGDSIKGVGDSPSYQYSYDPFTTGIPEAAVVSMAGMDGGNGGWAMLYGGDPVPTAGGGGTLYLAIDEDQSKDSERRHTTEQVAWFVIDPPEMEAAIEPVSARSEFVRFEFDPTWIDPTWFVTTPLRQSGLATMPGSFARTEAAPLRENVLAVISPEIQTESRLASLDDFWSGIGNWNDDATINSEGIDLADGEIDDWNTLQKRQAVRPSSVRHGNICAP